MAGKIDIYNKALLDLKETPLSQSDLGDSSNRRVQILDAYFEEAVHMASNDDDWTFLDMEIDLVTETATIDADAFVETFSAQALRDYSYEEEGKLLLVSHIGINGRKKEHLFRNITIGDGTVTYEVVVDEGAKGQRYSHCFQLPDNIRRVTHVYPEESGEFRRVGNLLYTSFIPTLVLGQTEETADEFDSDSYPPLYCDLIAHALAYVAGTAMTNNDQKTMAMIQRKFEMTSMLLSNSDIIGGQRRIFEQ